jgi:uncharacterized protein YjbJ (UPF0337 family)
MSQRSTEVSDQEPFAEERDRLAGRGDEPTGQVTQDEDLEAEAKRRQAAGMEEGPAEKVKEKGKELLDKISGPDVPPSLPDEERRG